MKVRIDLESISVEGHRFDEEPELHDFVRALGQFGGKLKNESQHLSQFYIFDRLGLLAATELGSDRVTDVVFFLEKDVSLYKEMPESCFSGRIHINGSWVERGIIQSDLNMSEPIQFRAEISSFWAAEGQGVICLTFLEEGEFLSTVSFSFRSDFS